MIPFKNEQSKTEVLAKKEELLKRRKSQYAELLIQFKVARNILISLGAILLVVLLLGTGALRIFQGIVFMFVAIAVILIFIAGYFGVIAFGAKFCKSMGKSSESAFLLTFGTFGIYALYSVVVFYSKNDKKEREKEIATLEEEIEQLKNYD